ncbi:MAG TPA: hypothetical protein VF158_10060 [Longimicrobiales bacterium]
MVNDRRAIGLLALLLCGCAERAGVTDYIASPVLAAQDWGDRLHVAGEGVRAIAGPVAVFPYEWPVGEGERERGQYQLFTRVVVHNTGREPVDVVWSGAVLEVPGGGVVRLLDTAEAADGAMGAPTARVERLAPGDRAMRALIPETVDEIAVGEPLVPLCDGCEYRLVIPVRRSGREQRLVLPFRLRAERPSPGSGPFWRGWED